MPVEGRIRQCTGGQRGITVFIAQLGLWVQDWKQWKQDLLAHALCALPQVRFIKWLFCCLLEVNLYALLFTFILFVAERGNEISFVRNAASVSAENTSAAPWTRIWIGRVSWARCSTPDVGCADVSITRTASLTLISSSVPPARSGLWRRVLGQVILRLCPSPVWRDQVRAIGLRWLTWVRHQLLFCPHRIPLAREDKQKHHNTSQIGFLCLRFFWTLKMTLRLVFISTSWSRSWIHKNIVICFSHFAFVWIFTRFFHCNKLYFLSLCVFCAKNILVYNKLIHIVLFCLPILTVFVIWGNNFV